MDWFFRSRRADPQAEADPPHDSDCNPPQSSPLDAFFEERERRESLEARLLELESEAREARVAREQREEIGFQYLGA